MFVAETIEAIRQAVAQARKAGKKIGLVPTMGALHRGHTSLIDRAGQDCDFVMVSIFVNPTQFGPNEDFDKYPRPMDKDLAICEQHDAAAVFAPTVEQMYGSGENLTWVTVEKLTEPLCGRNRPGHFRGVTTVCTKLFNIVGPDAAYFGQKDAQQSIVIKRMVADLNMPLKIVVCPTVREPDGLAISSRNQYLDEKQRADAVYIYKALQKAEQLIKSGLCDSEQIIAQMRSVLDTPGSLQAEYISIADAEDLTELKDLSKALPAAENQPQPRRVLIAAAVRAGATRLIDNIIVDIGG